MTELITKTDFDAKKRAPEGLTRLEACRTNSSETYDIAIIGSGISGSILACILARHGQKVLLLEAGIHPKFSIGESMILETSEIFRSLAKVYDVPELEYYSSENFAPYIGNSYGVKRHFSYIHQREGQPQNSGDVIQAVIPKAPYGHEIHIHRQDSDYFFASTAVKYGAKLLQNTTVSDVEIDDDGVTIKAKGETYRASYVVDAGGFRSTLAEQNNLRRRDLETHARGIFTHMIGVPSIHETGNRQKDYGIPYSLAEGTLHHIFNGGWMWVIPFNNHEEASNPLCSVGLMLDPRQYPEDASMTPEEEFWAFMDRFPGMKTHLEGAKAVRPWVRGGRIQYSSSAAHGKRFSLLGHAAGFIDPLFSKGLYTSMASIMGLAKVLIGAKADNDYSDARFEKAAATTLRYVENNDRLISNAYKSFVDPRLWHQYSVLWILGAYLELVRLTTYRFQMERKSKSAKERLDYPFPELSLVGGGYAPYFELADKMDREIASVDPLDEQSIVQAADNMRRHLNDADWIPYSFRELSNGKKHLPNRKFSWRLLMNKGGVMGEKVFREHFYEDLNLFDLATTMLKERWTYSRTALTRRKKRENEGAY